MISGRYLKAFVSRISHSEKPILIWKAKDDENTKGNIEIIEKKIDY